MIEVSTRAVDGVRFLNDIRILAPDDRVNGVGVHRISRNSLRLVNSGEFIKAIRLLGLRKVDYDLSYHAYLFAQYPMAVWQYKTIKFSLWVYWRIVRFLYDNARFFKEIPPSQPFSWKFFTPYVWFKNIGWSVRK